MNVDIANYEEKSVDSYFETDAEVRIVELEKTYTKDQATNLKKDVRLYIEKRENDVAENLAKSKTVNECCHSSYRKEYIRGAHTGDYICNSCGEVFYK